MNTDILSLWSAWFALLTLLTFDAGASKIFVSPNDTETVVGQTAFLNCSITSGMGRWTKNSVEVFSQGEIKGKFKDRFQLDINSSTSNFNLVIRDVTVADAGKYYCEDDDGLTEAAELIVIGADVFFGSNMNPSGIFGPNDCAIETEVLTLTCNVTYHGNREPHLQWFNVENGTKERTNCIKTIDGRFICTATIKSNLEMSNSTYVCRATRVFHPIICTSDVVKILYAFTDKSATEAALNEEVNCSQKTSQRCNYTWRQTNETVSHEVNLKPEKPGLYTCEAKCDFRDKTCTVFSFVYVSSSPSANTGTGFRNAVICICLSILLLATVIVIAVLSCYVHKYRERNFVQAQANIPLNNPNNHQDQDG